MVLYKYKLTICREDLGKYCNVSAPRAPTSVKHCDRAANQTNRESLFVHACAVQPTPIKGAR